MATQTLTQPVIISEEHLPRRENSARVQITITFQANMPEGEAPDQETLHRIAVKVRDDLNLATVVGVDDEEDEAFSVALRIVDASDMAEISSGEIEVRAV